jgi:hypothetical protein
MAFGIDAPGIVRIRYSGITIPHTQQIHVKFAETPTPGVEPVLETSGSAPINFVDGVTDFIDLCMQSQYNEDTTFGFAEVYAIDEETGLRTFLYTTNINLTGSNAAANVPITEGIWVFKSTVGKPIKIYEMEGVYSADARNVGIVPADERQDVIDYILSADNIVYGRTDGWPLAFQTFTSKENDVLRRLNGFTNT